MSDRDLQPFADALAGWLDERATVPPPDLADVLARADAMGDEPLPASLREGLDHDAVDDDGLDELDEPDPDLAVFARDLRSAREAHLRERELEAIPTAPGGQRRWIPYALAGLAAAALLVLGLVQLSPSEATVGGVDDAEMEAERNVVSREDGGLAREGASTPPKPRRATDEAPAHDDDLPEPVPEAPELAPEEPPEPAPPAPARPSVEDLERRARAAWKDGDLAHAQRLFRTVIRRSGRSTRAELAYGDLFSVVKQASGSAAQAKVWREYLRRFPRGRYADDARAGLCRRASEATQAECWTDYLRAHPAGAHAPQARRVTGQASL